ncbi:hypothetical protein EV360DRAFT_68433 [Lentinula raphanica]|nr:hypothetical protein EV360DRAFT_68433 [Lentinula raphanica]
MHISCHSTRLLLSLLLIVLLTTNTTLGIPLPIAHLPLYNHHHAHLCTTLPSGRSPAVSVNPYHRVTVPPSRIWYNSLGTHSNPSNPSNPHNPSRPAHSGTPGIPSNPASDPSHPVNPPSPAQLTIAFHNPTRYLSSPSYAFLSGVKALLRKAQSENRLLGEIPEDLLFQLRNGLYPKIPTSSTTTGTETNTPTHGPDTDTDALPDLLLTTKSTFVVKGGSCPFHGCAGYIYPAGVSELWNGGCLLTSIDEEGMHGVLRDGMRNFGFAKGALGKMGVPVVPVERDGVHVDVGDRVGVGTSQAESHTTAAAQRHPPNQPNPLDRSNSGPEPASSQPAHDAHTATSSTKPDQHTQLATDNVYKNVEDSLEDHSNLLEVSPAIQDVYHRDQPTPPSHYWWHPCLLVQTQSEIGKSTYRKRTFNRHPKFISGSKLTGDSEEGGSYIELFANGRVAVEGRRPRNRPVDREPLLSSLESRFTATGFYSGELTGLTE